MDSLYVALKNLHENYWLDTEFLSLLIALLAVFFGPIIAYFTAKRTMESQIQSIREQISAQTSISEKEINANVLSRNRQDWIDRLRNNISEFLSLCLITEDIKLSGGDLITIHERILTIRFRVTLFLNPKEEDHNKLVELMEEYIQQFVFNKKYEGGEEPSGLASQILKTSQTILKREWERVKILK